jgi:hypothetical protein
MGLTFIAVENPLGMLGKKGMNVPRGARHAKASKKHEREMAAQYEAEKKDVREKRERVLLNSGYDLEKDTSRESDAELAEDFEKRSSGTVKRAVAGSLVALFSRLEQYALGNPGGRGKGKAKGRSKQKRGRDTPDDEGEVAHTFDTLIFLGHGDIGSMSVGIGKVNIPGDVEGARELFQADKREIAHHNVDAWKSHFLRVRRCLSATGPIHIFLLGCSTGELEKLPSHGYTSLVKIVATTLAAAFNTTVVAYGPTSEIGDKETAKVLNEIDEIKSQAIASLHAELTYELSVVIDLQIVKA